MRKPVFCICENKDADQLRSNCAADQRLCFRYTDSTIPLLPKSEISSLWPSSVAVQPGLCRTRSETPKTGFLRTRLIYEQHYKKTCFSICIQKGACRPACADAVWLKSEARKTHFLMRNSNVSLTITKSTILCE